MLEVPPSILEVLRLSEGAAVEVAVEHGGLVVKPLLRPKYTLDELLAKCDATADWVWPADDEASDRGEDRPWDTRASSGNDVGNNTKEFRIVMRIPWVANLLFYVDK